MKNVLNKFSNSITAAAAAPRYNKNSSKDFNKPNHNSDSKSLSSLANFMPPLDTTDAAYCHSCNKSNKPTQAIAYVGGNIYIYKCNTCLKLIS